MEYSKITTSRSSILYWTVPLESFFGREVKGERLIPLTQVRLYVVGSAVRGDCPVL